MAQGWLVERLTHSTLWLGLVAAASQAPALVVSLLGGELADRFDRRTAILAANVVIGALSLLAAGLIARDRVTVVTLLVIELLIGSVIALEHPVDRSFIYERRLGRRAGPGGRRTKRKGRIVTLAALAGGLLLALFALLREPRSRSGSRRATGDAPTRSSRSPSWAAFRSATSCSERSRSGPARSRPCSSRAWRWRPARGRSGSGEGRARSGLSAAHRVRGSLRRNDTG